MTGKEFSDRIDLCLSKRNQTRKVLTQDLGIPSSTMSGWSASKQTIPRADMVEQIANYLGVSTDWLITGRNPEGITDEEAELLRRYRTLDARDKSVVTVLLNALASKEKTD